MIQTGDNFKLDYFLGISDLTVWTSTLVRTQQTAQFVNAPKTVFQELNEINAGKFEDFTFTEVMQSHPQEYAARQKDKLCYRYPQGMYNCFYGNNSFKNKLLSLLCT